MKSKLLPHITALSLFAALVNAPLFSQRIDAPATSTLSGAVKDSSGMAVPFAKVEMT